MRNSKSWSTAQSRFGLPRLRDIQHPRKLLRLEAVQELPQRDLVGLPAVPILRPPLRQCPVVGKARDTDALGKERALGIRRIQADLVGQQHRSILAYDYI